MMTFSLYSPVLKPDFPFPVNFLFFKYLKIHFYLCVPAISVSLYAGNGVESICREREVEEGEESAGQREERTWVEQGEIMEQERTNHYSIF